METKFSIVVVFLEGVVDLRKIPRRNSGIFLCHQFASKELACCFLKEKMYSFVFLFRASSSEFCIFLSTRVDVSETFSPDQL